MIIYFAQFDCNFLDLIVIITAIFWKIILNVTELFSANAVELL